MARMGAGIRPGLEITKELLGLLGNPQAGLRCLHVAGTNGKGSTCRFSHRLLSQAGLETGLFTSPHMVCVRERFVIGEEAISEGEFAVLLERVLPISERIGATYFETLTAVGALWFRDRGVQALVLETGLGGRLDSTTAFPAEVCAVTQVGLDHTQILGDTVEKIWREKIAILRPGKPLVTCQTRTDLLDELGMLARERGGRAVLLDPNDKFRLDGVPAGRMQEENLQVAVRSVELFLGRKLDRSAIEASLRGMRWPARFEGVPGDPETILDVGHNPDAAVELAALCEPIRPVLLFGAMSDKNWREVLRTLSPTCSAIHLAPLDTARAEDPFRIAKEFPEADAHPTYDAAWEAARNQARLKGIPLLVAGSFHTVGQAARRLWADGHYRFWPDGIVPDPLLPGMG